MYALLLLGGIILKVAQTFNEDRTKLFEGGGGTKLF